MVIYQQFQSLLTINETLINLCTFKETTCSCLAEKKKTLFIFVTTNMLFLHVHPGNVHDLVPNWATDPTPSPAHYRGSFWEVLVLVLVLWLRSFWVPVKQEQL